MWSRSITERNFIMGCWLLSFSNIVSLQYEFSAPIRCQSVLILKERDAVYVSVCVLEIPIVGYAVLCIVWDEKEIFLLLQTLVIAHHANYVFVTEY